MAQSFIFLHDSAHIVSGSDDGTMHMWDCDTGLLVWESQKGGGGSICALALSPDGKEIACGREDGSVQLWNTDGKLMEGPWTDGDDGPPVRLLSWSPSGGHIASGYHDGTILIRKKESGKVDVGPIETDTVSEVCSLAYSPCGDRIASGSRRICTWDSNTGELLVGPIEFQDANCLAKVTSVVWSPDGSRLYAASDKFVRVFESVSGTQLHRFKLKHHDVHDHWVTSIALSPKHNILACVTDGGIAQLWDTESHQALDHPFGEEGRKNLSCVMFSRDGKYLAYSGDDKKITLWMVKDIAPKLPVSVLSSHDYASR
jgi:WD40 repeat protein